MEDNEKEEERTSSKTLAELEAESLRRFEQFIEITWQPIPNRHKVRVWIDDGTFKMVMSNEKFIKTLEDILMDNQSQKTYYNMRNIENSLSQYQGFYQYNRQTDEYRALSQLRFNDKLTKQDLYENARADYDAKFGKDNILNHMVNISLFDKMADADIRKQNIQNNLLKNTARFYGGF